MKETVYNQNAIDNLYYVNYVENYLDSVENLPDDVQRYLSRMHELDISYRGYLKDIEGYKEILEKDDIEQGAQRKIMSKLEQVLILLQEVGDEKVEIGQQIIDLIDNKYRQLDQDLRKIDFCKDQENADPSLHKDSTVREGLSSGGGGGGTGGGNNGGGGSGGTGERGGGNCGGTGGEGGVNSGVGGGGGGAGTRGGGNKRPRRSRAETGGGTTGDAGNNPVETSGKKTTKKKKRKSKSGGGTGTSGGVIGEGDGGGGRGGEEELLDEPTYCLCDQISYGEMILCDNDLCPIEWFHFVCVSLSSKPKGKWFCPKCRGDRPNVMKPKSQFLKELERYNKEKEEKS